MAHAPSHLLRSAAAGLALGLLGAAGVLAWGAWEQAHLPCAFPGTEECTFEQSTGAEVARLRALAAVGCALLSGGLLLAVRRPPTTP